MVPRFKVDQHLNRAPILRGLVQTASSALDVESHAQAATGQSKHKKTSPEPNLWNTWAKSKPTDFQVFWIQFAILNSTLMCRTKSACCNECGSWYNHSHSNEILYLNIPNWGSPLKFVKMGWCQGTSGGQQDIRWLRATSVILLTCKVCSNRFGSTSS